MRLLKNRKFYLFACIACSFILCCFFYIKGFYYVENDDIYIAGIMGGAYGHNMSQMLVYPSLSSILTSIIYFIQVATNFFDVFGILMFICTFLTFVNLCISIYNTKITPFAYIAVLALNYAIFCYYTFTVVAGFLISSAIVLFYTTTTVDNKKMRVFCYVLYGFTAFLGISLRVSSFIPCIIALSPLAINMFFKNKKIALIGAACFIGIFGLTSLANNIAYNSDTQAKEFSEWNEASSNIRDYPQLNYEDHKDLYDQIGWTNNDFTMCQNLYIADNNVFSVDAYNTIQDHKTIHDKYQLNPVKLFDEIAHNPNFKAILLFGLIFLALYKSKNKRDLIIYLISILMPLFVILLLHIKQRCVFRVEFSVDVFAAIQYILLCLDKTPRLKGKINIVANVLAILFIVFCIYRVEYVYWVFERNFINDNMHVEELTNHIKKNPSKVYISLEGDLLNMYDTDPMTKDSFLNNVFFFGGWNSYSPCYYERLNNLDVQNPGNLFLETANNNNVYLASFRGDEFAKTRMDMITIYLGQHQGISGKFVKTHQFENGNLYQFVKN